MVTSGDIQSPRMTNELLTVGGGVAAAAIGGVAVAFLPEIRQKRKLEIDKLKLELGKLRRENDVPQSLPSETDTELPERQEVSLLERLILFVLVMGAAIGSAYAASIVTNSREGGMMFLVTALVLVWPAIFRYQRSEDRINSSLLKRMTTAIEAELETGEALAGKISLKNADESGDRYTVTVKTSREGQTSKKQVVVYKSNARVVIVGSVDA